MKLKRIKKKYIYINIYFNKINISAQRSVKGVTVIKEFSFKSFSN